MRSWIRPTAAVCFGLLATAVLLEVGLRVAAALASPSRVRIARKESGDGAPHVVFVGDSHTFGLWMEPATAMPGAVESLAATQAPPGLHAYNYGRAGATSFGVATDVEQAIANIRPDALVLRIGVNNVWTPRPEEASIFESLRIVRLGRVAYFALRGRPALGSRETWDVGMSWEEIAAKNRREKPEVNPGAIRERLERFSEPKPFDAARTAGLKADIEKLARSLAAAKCQLFLASYLDPAPDYQLVSDALAESARDLGVPFIDLRAMGRLVVDRGLRPEILYPDGHPRKLGYALEAREVVRAFLARGLLKGTPPGDSTEWVVHEVERQRAEDGTIRIELRWESDGAGGVRFVVAGKPDATGWLVLGKPGKSWRLDRYLVPIDRASAIAAGGRRESYFSTDSQGNGEVRIPKDLVEQLGPGTLAMAVLRGGTAGAETRVSLIVDLANGRPAPDQAEIDDYYNPKELEVR